MAQLSDHYNGQEWQNNLHKWIHQLASMNSGDVQLNQQQIQSLLDNCVSKMHQVKDYLLDLIKLLANFFSNTALVLSSELAAGSLNCLQLVLSCCQQFSSDTDIAQAKMILLKRLQYNLRRETSHSNTRNDSTEGHPELMPSSEQFIYQLTSKFAKLERTKWSPKLQCFLPVRNKCGKMIRTLTEDILLQYLHSDSLQPLILELINLPSDFITLKDNQLQVEDSIPTSFLESIIEINRISNKITDNRTIEIINTRIWHRNFDMFESELLKVLKETISSEDVLTAEEIRNHIQDHVIVKVCAASPCLFEVASRLLWIDKDLWWLIICFGRILMHVAIDVALVGNEQYVDDAIQILFWHATPLVRTLGTTDTSNFRDFVAYLRDYIKSKGNPEVSMNEKVIPFNNYGLNIVASFVILMLPLHLSSTLEIKRICKPICLALIGNTRDYLEVILHLLDDHQVKWKKIDDTHIHIYTDILHDLIQSIESELKAIDNNTLNLKKNTINYLESYKNRVQSLKIVLTALVCQITKYYGLRQIYDAN
ncbi:uncharacterized protein TRIADDRAFT_58885 [Trichoplax adhaerens]|uniref:Uncharacterized protein n=1 Tax=Trichoplax adhaerens TaxID=10228 RepID=B3S3Y0_TRIAD|nr:predicted protein [Trichoplax adhaerens]EDV22359.1 predicted protein [Trichoplax adhaerens]|eukprot:XP_002114903.1 predicted protein [Trichoplax adhaerens]